jgi:hypothetical protein
MRSAPVKREGLGPCQGSLPAKRWFVRTILAYAGRALSAEAPGLRPAPAVIGRFLARSPRPSRVPLAGAPPPHPAAPPLTASPNRRRMARGQRAIARPTHDAGRPWYQVSITGQAGEGTGPGWMCC